jgi:predicted GNAT family acetyltransferase
MDIHHTEQDNRGSFYIKEGYNILGQMTYHVTGTHLIIEHTEVDEKLQGQQAGKKLLDRAADLARAEQKKILALCTFAKTLLEKRHNEYKDVL